MSNQQNTKQKWREGYQTSEENQQNQTDSNKNDRNEPHIMKSETNNNKVSSATNKAGDPGRTPGKAEG